ncbi:MAG TPA: Hsp70 family protein [Ktedonosporobacter sp.]|nr:Hsp70 family protein [Ktedonosporobacter sp.]
MSNQRRIIFGIDLGTTYSCISYVDEHGKATILPSKEHGLTTPSVIFFEGENRVVGEEAKNNAFVSPESTVEMVKRHMGEANWRFLYEEQEYTAEELSAYILRKLALDAQGQLNIPVRDVVITCPAYFGVAQREATARAGEIAGLTVHEVINEPTAAAITYGLQTEEDQVVLVYDLGGGTFDVTIIEIKASAITVVATGGDHHLGGRNWDEAVIIYLAQRWQAETGLLDDPTDSLETLQDLWLKAEKAKWALSARNKTTVVVSHAGKNAKVTLTRAKFDELTAGLLDRTVLFTKMTMEEARTRGYDRLDKVLLVGGSTRMPQVEERLERELHLPIRLFEPDEAVAKGAAIYGQKLLINQQVHERAAAMSGVPIEEAITLKEFAVPVIEQAQQEIAQTLGIQARTLEKLVKTSITNVTSHSFGIIVTVDHHTARRREAIENLMLANDPLPAMRVQIFGTLENDQAIVELQVMENTQKAPLVELEQDAQALEIGKVVLPLPPGLPAGSPIEVTFELDGQGRLHVIGREPQSKAAVEATFETKGGISQQEVQDARSRVSSIRIL